jgi:hypothetical protein
MLRFEAAQHVVKGTVFKHEHDNVIKGIETWWHKVAPFVCASRGSAAQESPFDSNSESIPNWSINLNV